MKVPVTDQCHAAGAGDVALGALAMGLNAAEGIARTFGLGRKQDSLEADDDDEGHEMGYDAEDEEDCCWEEDEEEEEEEVWASPAEALMSATDQLAVSIMEAQVSRPCLWL